MIGVRASLAMFLLSCPLAVAAPPSPLALTPTRALCKVAELDGRDSEVTKDERRLLDAAKNGKFDRMSFTEACLIAGGITDPRERKKYLARLDSIEADARKATAGSKSVAEDGARLLKFLHAGPMAKGYKSKQTDLHILLDTGEFNCVSSAVLYTVMAQRLGIDVRAVELPEHVFSILATRDRKIDVETTSSLGFDMDPKRRTGPSKANRPTNNRREVGPPGLAAIIAYNHGVTLASQKRFPESIRANLIALGLDPHNKGAVSNLITDLRLWSLELATAGKYEKAMAVVSVGHELVPKDSRLHEITRVLCDAWASDYIERRDWTGAAQVYARGLREFPNDKLLAYNLAVYRARIR